MLVALQSNQSLPQNFFLLLPHPPTQPCYLPIYLPHTHLLLLLPPPSPATISHLSFSLSPFQPFLSSSLLHHHHRYHHLPATVPTLHKHFPTSTIVLHIQHLRPTINSHHYPFKVITTSTAA